MNHWIATNRYCIRESLNIIFTRHAQNVRLQRVPRSRMSTNWQGASRVGERMWITLISKHEVGDVAPASTCLRSWWRQTFRAYDVKLMWLTTRFTIFETITASRPVMFVAIQWFEDVHINTTLTLDGSICHLKFSKVVPAHKYFKQTWQFMHIFVMSVLQDMRTNFMMALGKPKLHTKFEVAIFNRCRNIKSEPQILGSSPSRKPRPLFPLGVILWWALVNPNCTPNLKSLALAIAKNIKGELQNFGELS